MPRYNGNTRRKDGSDRRRLERRWKRYPDGKVTVQEGTSRLAKYGSFKRDGDKISPHTLQDGLDLQARRLEIKLHSGKESK